MSEFFNLVGGALIGWFTSHWYFAKASRDQAGAVRKLTQDLRPKTTLHDFEEMLARSSWTKNYIDHTELWIADEDNTFQMQRGEKSQDFTERWTKVHPDPNSASYRIYLKIGSSVIKELTFISADGGRIFVPMPGVRPLPDETTDYFWNLGSLEVRVCRVVGEYYRYNNLEGVARRSNVSLVA
jgi:hypothetical protein